jgi:hypothetical protein
VGEQEDLRDHGLVNKAGADGPIAASYDANAAVSSAPNVSAGG